MTFWKNKNILVTGGAGFLGSSIINRLHEDGVSDSQISVPRSKEMDLRNLGKLS